MEGIPIPSGDQTDAANANTSELDVKLLLSYWATMVTTNLSLSLNAQTSICATLLNI